MNEDEDVVENDGKNAEGNTEEAPTMYESNVTATEKIEDEELHEI
jgi:hypothetical protein